MKKRIAAAALLLLLAGCTQNIGSSSMEAPSQPVSTSIPTKPETEAPSFGENTRIKSDPILQYGLTFHWTDTELDWDTSLADYSYTSYYTGQDFLSNWQGRRNYEMDGYMLTIILHGDYGAPEEELWPGFCLTILTDEKRVLDNGLHVGMRLSDAKILIRQNMGEVYSEFFLEDIIADPENHSYEQSLVAWHQYREPEALFYGYDSCLAFMYSPEPESLARALCLYADETGTIAAITSTFCTIP